MTIFTLVFPETAFRSETSAVRRKFRIDVLGIAMLFLSIPSAIICSGAFFNYGDLRIAGFARWWWTRS